MQLVAAFATRADLLILDEPTSGLDPLMEVAFRQTVLEAKERGQTVFLSSHILSEVEALCDRVGILREGRLVDEGTLARAAASEVADGRGHVRRRAAGARRASRACRSWTVAEHVAARGERRARSRSWPRSPVSPVTALTSREPSLEEIFLHHYDGSEPVARR